MVALQGGVGVAPPGTHGGRTRRHRVPVCGRPVAAGMVHRHSTGHALTSPAAGEIEPVQRNGGSGSAVHGRVSVLRCTYPLHIPVEQTPGGGDLQPAGMAIDATKLAPPRPSVRQLHRRRLLDVVDTTPDRGLCVISGGPGFGKTQLLGELAAEPGHRVAWLTVEAADNDPSRFWTYLTDACRRAWQVTPLADERSGQLAVADAESFIDAALARRRRRGLDRDRRRTPAGRPRRAERPGKSRPTTPCRYSHGGRIAPRALLGASQVAGCGLRRRRSRTGTDPRSGRGGRVGARRGLGVSPEVVEQLRARTEGLAAVVQLAIRAALDEDDPESFIRPATGRRPVDRRLPAAGGAGQPTRRSAPVPARDLRARPADRLALRRGDRPERQRTDAA